MEGHDMRGLTDTERPQAAAFMASAVPHFSDASKGKGAYLRAGIGDAWKTIFPDVDFRLACDELKADKLIDILPVKGGVVVFLWADRPDSLKQRDAQMAKVNGFADAFKAKLAAPITVPDAPTPQPQPQPEATPVTVSAAVASPINGKKDGGKQSHATA